MLVIYKLDNNSINIPAIYKLNNNYINIPTVYPKLTDNNSANTPAIITGQEFVSIYI